MSALALSLSYFPLYFMDQRVNEIHKADEMWKIINKQKIEFDVDSLLESIWKMIFYSDFIFISIIFIFVACFSIGC